MLWIQAGIYFTWFPPENNTSDLGALCFSLTSETPPSAQATDPHPSALGPVKTTMVMSNSCERVR